jgi:hypothetical protein
VQLIFIAKDDRKEKAVLAVSLKMSNTFGDW